MDEAGHALVDQATRDAVLPSPGAIRVLVGDDEDDIRDLVCLAVVKAGLSLIHI